MDEANGDLDPEVLLAAANAAFRSHEREGGAGPAQVQRLDGVLQAYVAVLKAAPTHMDAAYNYEYVSRLRDQVARSAGKPAKELRSNRRRASHSRAICRPAPPCTAAQADRRPT